VIRADGREFGLIVDAVRDTEEIVVKPLGKLMKGIEAYAGATIMRDGKVAVILDVLGPARYTSVISKESEHQALDTGLDANGRHSDTETVLVCGVVDCRRAALPRLELPPQHKPDAEAPHGCDVRPLARVGAQIRQQVLARLHGLRFGPLMGRTVGFVPELCDFGRHRWFAPVVTRWISADQQPSVEPVLDAVRRDDRCSTSAGPQ
jgi:two-component system chemotaxis sensor kinase CheA